MRKIRVLIIMGCCLFAITLTASSQAARKPGLWETTSTMSWQKSPLPPGVNLPPGMKSPFSGMTVTAQTCYTQEMIDKYGGPMSRPQGGCKITNIVQKPNGMSADLVCTGNMSGKGEVWSSWTDSNHTSGKMHFAGTMQSGQNSTPVEWTTTFTSTYKGPDCGNVKPVIISNN
jgi:hypothetical protein